MAKLENMSLVSYDKEWPDLFKKEAILLMSKLPEECLLEFHHIGSTAIAGMSARPIIDLGIMVTDLELAKEKMVPIFKKNGYLHDDRSGGPSFMVFYKRDNGAIEGYDVYMAEEENSFWDRLYFREYLKANKDEARNYFELKDELSKSFPNDLEAYLNGKTNYVKNITEKAKSELGEL